MLFWSILLKIAIQVQVLSIYIHIKAKKPPRLVRGRQAPRAAASQFKLARITIVVLNRKGGRKTLVMLFYLLLAGVPASLGLPRVNHSSLRSGETLEI